jgi:phytoene dehydrogenase-like protein
MAEVELELERTRYDAIVIGAGPNGLTAGAYLAKAGKSVLVLERRSSSGGLASTYEFAPGFRASMTFDLVGLLLREVIDELELERHGLEILPMDPIVFAPGRSAEGLLVWRDETKTVEEIRKISPHDANRYPQFASLVRQFTGFLKPLLAKPVPTPEIESGADLLSLLKLGWDFRKLGVRPMHELMRVLPMSVQDFLNEWFESDLVKAAIAGPALEALGLGPRSAGTAGMFLYQQLGMGDGGPLQARALARGGAGGVTDALRKALESHGGTVHCGAGVERLLLEDGEVRGVRLDSGQEQEQELQAEVVVSSLAPRASFRALGATKYLQPEFVWELDRIRYQGVTAKLNLALSELPDYRVRPGKEVAPHHRAVLHVGPTLDDLERAYDSVKYGRISERPFLQAVIPSLADPSLAPDGQHVMSVLVQFAPYTLRGESWEDEKVRTTLTNRVVDALDELAPNTRSAILHKHLLTPLDYEKELGLPEGSWHHGEMALDQMFFMRPVPGWARYETPIHGFYLCGSGTHPGGGITGAPGRNAARELLR